MALRPSWLRLPAALSPAAAGGTCGSRQTTSRPWANVTNAAKTDGQTAANTRLKFTGLTQNLGQPYGSYRDFQPNCWVDLRILGQPCGLYLTRRQLGTPPASAAAPQT
jgi:hypothetical protein